MEKALSLAEKGKIWKEVKSPGAKCNKCGINNSYKILYGWNVFKESDKLVVSLFSVKHATLDIQNNLGLVEVVGKSSL